MKTRAAGRCLRDLGEDALVRRIARRVAGVRPDVLIGVGDDCAVVRPVRAGRVELLKTDCVLEGVHFEPSASRASVGWKAAARVVSDLAAMGARPRHALVTVALHPDRPVRELDALYRGLARAAGRFGFAVVGGELTRSEGPLWVSVAMTGEAGRVLTRGGGAAGDRLYVTGRLGGSGGGRHLRFMPRLEEGCWLAGQPGVRAMMDLSDGLAADLPRLASASGCGFEVELARLPCHRGVAPDRAIADGEDYELLVAVAPGAASGLERRWRSRFPRVSLRCVGRLVARGEQWVGGGTTGRRSVRGWDHFTPAR